MYLGGVLRGRNEGYRNVSQGIGLVHELRVLLGSFPLEADESVGFQGGYPAADS